jgi:hypothetical protein
VLIRASTESLVQTPVLAIDHEPWPGDRARDRGHATASPSASAAFFSRKRCATPRHHIGVLSPCCRQRVTDRDARPSPSTVRPFRLMVVTGLAIFHIPRRNHPPTEPSPRRNHPATEPRGQAKLSPSDCGHRPAGVIVEKGADFRVVPGCEGVRICGCVRCGSMLFRLGCRPDDHSLPGKPDDCASQWRARRRRRRQAARHYQSVDYFGPARVGHTA